MNNNRMHSRQNVPRGEDRIQFKQCRSDGPNNPVNVAADYRCTQRKRQMRTANGFDNIPVKGYRSELRGRSKVEIIDTRMPTINRCQPDCGKPKENRKACASDVLNMFTQ